MATAKRRIEHRAAPRTAGEDYPYDLAVAYRVYPKVASPARNLPLGDDKLKQAEICLRSFRDSLGDLRVKLWAILDGCPDGYRSLFRSYFAAEDLDFVAPAAAGNKATFANQIDILLAQRSAEHVYFAEDDYLYLPDQFPLMLKFLCAGKGVDFVSPYDHPDCYELDLHRERKWVTVFENHHWRTASSTCLTFLTRKSTLARYELVFRGYSTGNDDCPLWLSLTKRRVFNPIAAARYLARHDFYRKILPKAWTKGWRQILFGKKANLWVPIPGIATHLSEGQLSAGTDWIALMRSEQPVSGPFVQNASANPRGNRPGLSRVRQELPR